MAQWCHHHGESQYKHSWKVKYQIHHTGRSIGFHQQSAQIQKTINIVSTQDHDFLWVGMNFECIPTHAMSLLVYGLTCCLIDDEQVFFISGNIICSSWLFWIMVFPSIRNQCNIWLWFGRSGAELGGDIVSITGTREAPINSRLRQDDYLLDPGSIISHYPKTQSLAEQKAANANR